MEIIKQTHGESINEGHLGGWAMGGDGGTYYPKMWSFLIKNYNIKSVLDIGCGRGYSTRFFKSLGCSVKGIDGSKKAQELFLMSKDEFILHDFSQNSIYIDEKFDLGWSCEFVEHVEEQFIPNFIEAFKKCKYIAMTFAEKGQGGHHHVNENDHKYWIKKFNDYNFSFLYDQTMELRSKAMEDKEERLKDPTNPFFISHFVDRGLFFENLEW